MPTPSDFAFVATGTAGIVLAAGGGKRFGGPKALAISPDGTPWLVNAVRSLLGGGCAPVIVVLGSAADEAEALLSKAFAVAGGDDGANREVRVVRSADWQTGMAASLRAGLLAANEIDPRPVAVAVVTVDVPSLSSAMVRRLVAPAPGPTPVEPATLRQASFSGAPGHPVVIGRAHWGALVEQLHGDTGARRYLRAHGATVVDCSDLGSGMDIDVDDRTP
ncbi:NTP transferase domain-containing protein [Agreia sp. COWG]|uniref:nucleotidyltransferase family protein n=1 Tax=Agreia sp. COWG TaxID=2773266 RepID=UPI0019290197|nr:nucleotidyltransferase family protein [Agreia sp. COWG]CAD5994956.1 NTP_transf_3 domain-containing protein [Agreia sp. COWG]